MAGTIACTKRSIGIRLSAVGCRSLLLGFLPLIAGCGFASQPTYKIGVPFEYQQNEGACQYTGMCGPAVIRMWTRFDSRGFWSQSYIASSIGARCPQSASFSQILSGVQGFTYTGRDAYIDDNGGQGDPEDLKAAYFSRQIRSIENKAPVVGLMFGLHVGILNGGKWSDRIDGYRQWDYVYVHDPLPTYGGKDIYYTAGSWISLNCSEDCYQIVSQSAVVGWEANLLGFGEAVKVRGFKDWPPRDWPPEY